MVIQTADGLLLESTLYHVDHEAPPGLVLLHDLGGDRHVWQRFARQAQQRGYACVAPNLRGHGHGPPSYRSFTHNDWRAAVDDITGAIDALTAAGASPQDIGIVGAGLGASIALHFALDHEQVACLVLVSPGLNDKGLGTENEIAAYGRRPVLLVTTEGDAYSAATCSTLKRNAQDLCELVEFAGTAHGTDIFAILPDAIPQTIRWLDLVLGD